MTNAGEPYPGLRPFRKDEHSFFFGRFEHTAALYRLLDRGRLLAILGGSGSGKSSLVLAGLLPLLEKEKRSDGTPRWTMVMLRPGSQPMRRLAAALLESAASAEESIQRVIAGLRHTSRGLVTEIERLLPTGREVLIPVDQFEELFRYAQADSIDGIDSRDPAVAKLSRDDEARRFVDLLLTAAASSRRRIRIVITMRSEFLGDCARYRGLAEAVSANQYLAPWLNREQQAEAIVGPLLRGAGRLAPDVFELTSTNTKDWSDLIEPQLVEQLLNDAGNQPDQLPVLQHALRRCWQEAAGSRLTLQRYRDLGGWGVILSNHADQVMQRCGAGRGTTVERIFRALIQRDGIGRAIRRPCTIAQLVAETGEREAHIRAVVTQFSAADCSFIAPPTAPDELIDIGHEALIRQWRKIASSSNGWLQEESRDGLIWRLLLFRAQGHEKNPEDVLSVADIEERQPWFEQHNERWAERYGGRWQLVDKLMRASNRARHTGRRKKIAVRATILAFSVGILMAWIQINDANRDAARALAVSIGLQLEFPDGAVESGDMKALLELARDEDGDMRLAFIKEVSLSPDFAGRLARNVAVVTRALVGVDQARRQELITFLFDAEPEPAQDGNSSRNSSYARALLGAELAAADAVERILTALQEATDPNELKSLGEGLAAVSVTLSGEQALQAVKPMLDVMLEATSSNELKILRQGLAALPVDITGEQAPQLVEPILELMHNTTDPRSLARLGEGLAALPVNLNEEQVLQAIKPVLVAILSNTDAYALKRLAEGLAGLPVELAGEQVVQAAEQILDVMQETTDPRSLGRLAEGLAALPVDLTEDMARPAIDPILAAMLKTKDPYALKRLGEGLAALPVEFTDEQAQQAVVPILAALRGSTDAYALARLGEVLAALAPKLTEEHALPAIKPVLSAMRGTVDPDALWSLGACLAALGSNLTEAQALQGVDSILDIMQEVAGQQPTDTNILGSLGIGLASLAAQLTEGQALQATKPILAAMQENTELDVLESLGEGLAALTVRLEGAQAAQPLIDALKIPWMAGAPSDILLNALQNQLVGEGGETTPNLWKIVGLTKQRFGDEIDVTSPPAEPAQEARNYP